jgi:hypothetical protein
MRSWSGRSRALMKRRSRLRSTETNDGACRWDRSWQSVMGRCVPGHPVGRGMPGLQRPPVFQ